MYTSSTLISFSTHSVLSTLRSSVEKVEKLETTRKYFSFFKLSTSLYTGI